ncbi:MAG: hypothetical protein ACR2H9_12060 [Longimicrobiaceae bacterium]
MSTKPPSFTRQLFAGAIDDSILFPYPTISPEEDRRVNAFLAELKAFCERHVDPDWIDENERIPAEVIDGLRRLVLVGISIP